MNNIGEMMIATVDKAYNDGMLLVYSGDFKRGVVFDEKTTTTSEEMFDLSEVKAVQNMKHNRYTRRRNTRLIARKRSKSDRFFYGDDESTKFGREIAQVGRYEKNQKHLRPHRDELDYQFDTNHRLKRDIIADDVAKDAMKDYLDSLTHKNVDDNKQNDYHDAQWDEWDNYQSGKYDESVECNDDSYDDWGWDYDDWGDYDSECYDEYDDEDESKESATIPFNIRNDLKGTKSLMQLAQNALADIDSNKDILSKEDILLQLNTVKKYYTLAEELVSSCVE